LAAEQEEHEDFERLERAKIEANMAKLLADLDVQRYSQGDPKTRGQCPLACKSALLRMFVWCAYNETEVAMAGCEKMRSLQRSAMSSPAAQGWSAPSAERVDTTICGRSEG
jgi:hypothetical protein